jgi:hypothetical protein
MMPRGGKRKGAGAPKGNQNALKHVGRAKVRYGVPLDVKLTRFEYRALCMEQLQAIKELDDYLSWTSPLYLEHKNRYKGAIYFREARIKCNSYNSLELIPLAKAANAYFKKY